MGHAAHFLRRLDRLSDPHVELALTLYNDPQLLGATLKRAKLPEGAERVAITLDDPELGPFVVVTREGRFVTCLGRGMRVSGTPIITREQLDAAAHRVERMREAIAQSRHLGANQGLFRKQVAPLYKDAEWVSREQLEDIARWEPLLGTVFAAECVHLATQLMDTRRRVKNILRPHARHKRLLSSYHRILHSLGHLYVLTAISPTGRELLLEAMRPHEEMTWAWAGLRHDVSYVLYRALWSAGKVGKPLLPALKRRLRGQLTYLGTADGILGAAMIGLAHDKVRAEVRKVLASPRASVPEDDDLIPAFDKLLMSSLDVCFDFPDTCETLFVGGAREMLFEKTPLREEYGWERPEDIPSELCYGAMLQVPRPLLHHVESLAGSLFVLPWLARAEASQLYLPQRFIDLVRHPWTMEQTIALLESQRQEEGVRRPVKNEKTGRNDPCPCGSGKKYKRCCALKPSAPDE